ncbi:MAG: O-antigen ligase family protein [Anaerolineales bacterium]|nr:O-antigen ligase family protein [Anaerolineales bacterium]
MLRPIAGRVAAAELLVLLGLAPALLFPQPLLTPVLLALPGLWLCARLAGGRFVPRTPLDLALLLLLATLLLSLFVTSSVRDSLGKICSLLLGIAVFYALVRWTTNPARLRAGLAAFVLLGAAFAAVALVGTEWPEKVSGLSAVTRRLPALLRGIPGAADGFQPNVVGGSVLLFVPLQLGLLAAALRRPGRLEARDWPGWLAHPPVVLVQVGLLILTAGTLLLSQSRGAWAGAAAGLAAYALWHSRRTRLGLAAVLLVVALAAVLWGPARLAAALLESFGSGLSSDVVQRLELWSRALYAIADFPITGLGLNQFRRVMPVLYPAFLQAPGFDTAHAHNHLLQAALDLGLPGLVAYLALWLLAGVLLWRACRRAPPAWLRTAAEGLGAGLIAYFVFGLTDAIPLGAKIGILFWLVLALSVSLHAHSGSDALVPAGVSQPPPGL